MIERLTQDEIREACKILRKAFPTEADVERVAILTKKWNAAKQQALAEKRKCSMCGLPWARCKGHGRATV